MYRTVQDFLGEWTSASAGTIRVLESLTDDKLGQSIVEGHSSLGWLGWHLATCPMFFGGQVGLTLTPVGNPKEVPGHAAVIVEAYKKIAANITSEVEKLTDEQMVESVQTFAGLMPRGTMLRTLIDHQTHHRGQMTVLLRQAGLHVPGLIGPTREEQAQKK